MSVCVYVSVAVSGTSAPEEGDTTTGKGRIEDCHLLTLMHSVTVREDSARQEQGLQLSDNGFPYQSVLQEEEGAGEEGAGRHFKDGSSNTFVSFFLSTFEPEPCLLL